MESDRPDGRERGVLEGNAVGNRHGEVGRDVVDLGVRREARTGAGDAIARREVAHSAAGGEHDPRGGIAERRRLPEPEAHRLRGRAHAVASRLVEHEPRLVGPRPRLGEEALAPGLDRAALGSGAHEAGADVDEHALRTQLGPGNVEHLDPPVAKPMRDLLQSVDSVQPGLHSLPMARDRTKVAVIALGAVGEDTGGRTYLAGILGPLAATPGFEVELHLGDPQFEPPPGCHVVRHRVPRRAAGRIAAEAWVARSLAGRDFDVLLAPLNYIPHLWRGPAVVVEHNLLTLPSEISRNDAISRTKAWYRPRALHSTLRRAREVVAVSEYLRGRLLAEVPSLDPDRVRVIPLGLPPDWAERTAHRTVTGSRVLVVSALSGYKRIGLAIEAFARAVESVPDATLTIAGPGSPERARELKRLADQRGVADRVSLLGNVPHDTVAELYGGSAVVLHLSTLESFALPVLEAMGAGVPIVASRIESNAELGGDAPLWLDPAAGVDETAALLVRRSDGRRAARRRDPPRPRTRRCVHLGAVGRAPRRDAP